MTLRGTSDADVRAIDTFTLELRDVNGVPVLTLHNLTPNEVREIVNLNLGPFFDNHAGRKA